MRISTRGLIVAVAVVGFDAAAMTRAVQQGRAAHAVREYAIGFGLVLLVFNLIVIALLAALSRKASGKKGGVLTMTPSPLMIAGFYVAALTFAVLSVLFFTSGRF